MRFPTAFKRWAPHLGPAALFKYYDPKHQNPEQNGHLLPKTQLNGNHKANHSAPHQRLHMRVQQSLRNRRVRGLLIMAFFLLLAVFYVLASLAHRAPSRKTSQKQQSEDEQEQYQQDEQPPTPKGLVLASYSTQDVSWLTEVPPEWNVYRYILDSDSLKELPPPPSNMQAPMTTLAVPKNQGREAMAYLTFILDTYATPYLPLVTVFMHGHDRSWHQPERAVDKLRALNLTALDRDTVGGFASLRCGETPNCVPRNFLDLTRGEDAFSWSKLKPLPAFWSKILFPNSVTGLEKRALEKRTLPKFVAQSGGGQFAVTRGAVMYRPYEFWQRLREPLEADLNKGRYAEKGFWGNIRTEEGEPLKVDGYTLGVLFERTWHSVFGTMDVLCPGEGWCRNTLFSGAISCNRYPTIFKEMQDWADIQCHTDEGRMRLVDQENNAVLYGLPPQAQSEAIQGTSQNTQDVPGVESQPVSSPQQGPSDPPPTEPYHQPEAQG